MRLLQVHSQYLSPGGEDVVADQELALWQRFGHPALAYRRSNKHLTRLNEIGSFPAMAVWSQQAYRDVKRLISGFRPEIVHMHNTWYAASPSPCWAAANHGIPVVQTLHSFRLLCPAAILFRGGKPCEACLGRQYPWPAALHACYRQSRLLSVVVGGSVAVHRAIGTWTRKVDVYIALTEFARRKFVEGGLPENKVVVKPNFVHPDPGERDDNGAYALFVGRFSPEKGVGVLLDACQRASGVPMKLAGDGPLIAEAVAFAENRGLRNVELLGWRPREEVLDLMKGARFLVFPSQWYETFGMTIVEAFACGTPVIASRLGAMAEIVEDGRTGLHFNPGDPLDLAAKVEWAWTHPEQMREMGREARREFELKYTAERNYQMLMDIYQLAAERHRAR